MIPSSRISYFARPLPLLPLNCQASGRSTAASRRSRPNQRPSSYPPADRWAPRTPPSKKHSAHQRQRSRDAFTKSTKTISCGLDQERSRGSKKWRARFILTRSSNHELRDRDGQSRAATTESCHLAKDRRLLRGARGRVVVCDRLHFAHRKRVTARASFVVRTRFVGPHAMRSDIRSVRPTVSNSSPAALA